MASRREEEKANQTPNSDAKSQAASRRAPRARRDSTDQEANVQANYGGQDSEKPRRREEEFYENMDAISRRLEKVEGLIDSIKTLSLKIEHSWEHMATKADISQAAHKTSNEISSIKADIMAEVTKRPTTSMIWVVIGACLMFGALPFLPEWWHRVSSFLPASQGVVNPQAAHSQVTVPPKPPKK